jgi:hypothetical protein
MASSEHLCNLCGSLRIYRINQLFIIEINKNLLCGKCIDEIWGKTTYSNYKERPRCRKVINKMIRGGGINLQDIGYPEKNDFKVFVSDGLKLQARKMLVEGYEE